MAPGRPLRDRRRRGRERDIVDELETRLIALHTSQERREVLLAAVGKARTAAEVDALCDLLFWLSTGGRISTTELNVAMRALKARIHAD